MMDAKRELRQSMLQMRRQLNPVQKARMDAQITRKLAELPAFFQAEELLLYAATEIEVDTREILRVASELGKRVYFPCCQVAQRAMRFYQASSFEEMRASHYGILEPAANPDAEWMGRSRPLCIVPALAVDRRGMRLGYGGGYYDRFLARHPLVQTIGLCYTAGLVDLVPTEAYDIPLGMILTETTLEVCNGGASESI